MKILNKMQGYIVIFLVTNALMEDREKLLAAGFNGHIEKAFNPKLVISQIRKLIGEDS